MKKNGFLTFLCACLPGCGQMYQGYMKRGVSLLFWFCALFALSILTGVGVLMVLPVVIWAYSFFDSFNLRNLPPEQAAALADDFVPSAAWLRQQGLEKIAKSASAPRVVGWALIILGAVMIYNNFLTVLMRYLREWFPFLGFWLGNASTLIIAVVVIVLGVYMLRGPARRQQRPNDDFLPYKGEDEGGGA